MLLKKTERLIITFSTTTQAIAMERVCAEKGIEGRLIPVPVQISAGCGMAWSAPVRAEQEILMILREEHITAEGKFRVQI